MVKHADEVVYVVGSVSARIESFGQGEERLWVIGEVVDVEDGFRVGDVVLLQVSIKTCPWSSGNNMPEPIFICCIHFDLLCDAQDR